MIREVLFKEIFAAAVEKCDESEGFENFGFASGANYLGAVACPRGNLLLDDSVDEFELFGVWESSEVCWCPFVDAVYIVQSYYVFDLLVA